MCRMMRFSDPTTTPFTGATLGQHKSQQGHRKWQGQKMPSSISRKMSASTKRRSSQQDEKKKGEGNKGFIHRGVQTQAREMETQTDPYSPPYKLPRKNKDPKILALMDMTWGQGLPFTLDDIVIIERAFSKRLLDQADAGADDPNILLKKVHLMRDLEAQQWADREKEFSQIVRLKMEVTTKLLFEYDAKISSRHTIRLERLQAALNKRNDKLVDLIRSQFFRTLRLMERPLCENDKPKKNVIKDTLACGSEMNTPLTRNGPNLDMLYPAPPMTDMSVKREFEAFRGILESEYFLNTELAFNLPSLRERLNALSGNIASERRDQMLEKTLQIFEEWDAVKPDPFAEWLALNEANATPGRMSHPIILLDGATPKGKRRHHCVTLQKIGRGRMIQRMIRGEIRKNMKALLGMRHMFDMDPNGLHVEEGHLQKLWSMKQERLAQERKDAPMNEVMGHLEGETLHRMLDFLEREMIRLIDERKIHALIILAERDRRLKEAEEGGRRQYEEEMRRLHDETFKHIVGIHQSTVDLYLEDIYIESCDRKADDGGREYVRQLARTLNRASYDLEQRMTDFQAEEVTAHVVASFVVPELQRLTHEERLEAAKRRYKKAAKQVLQGAFAGQGFMTELTGKPLTSLVEENLVKGWAATDGSVSAIEDFIKLAALEVLKAQDEAADILAEAEAERKGTLKEDQVPASEEVSPEISDDSDSSAQRRKKKKHYVEPMLGVHEDIKNRVAAKALQIQIEGEPSPRTDALYLGVKSAVDEIILAARRKVFPAELLKPEVKKKGSSSEEED